LSPERTLLKSAEKERLIIEWLRWNIGHNREAWQTPEYLIGVLRGFAFRGSMIYEADGSTPLATYERKMGTGMRGTLRVTLPNQLTYTRHMMIRRAAAKADVPVLIVPRAVLAQAEIRHPSIQIIHTRETKEPFRAAEQLIQAEVRTYVGMRTLRNKNGWVTGYTDGYDVRLSYFLSGFDRNERRLSYFFCELPPGANPATVDEAYLALKPASVHKALEEGRRVMRQGDMFLIAMPWRHHIPRALVEQNKYVHGTNHRATNYVEAGGLTYVRGLLQHRPAGRRPDHATLHLGHRWWLCVKNTVPVTR
jgi:hypothetical protein